MACKTCMRGKKKLPPIKVQMQNAAKSLYKNAFAVVSGKPVFSDAEMAMRRLQICEGCTNLRADMRCTQCGCFVKPKVKLKQEECPMGYW